MAGRKSKSDNALHNCGVNLNSARSDQNLHRFWTHSNSIPPPRHQIAACSSGGGGGFFNDPRRLSVDDNSSCSNNNLISNVYRKKRRRILAACGFEDVDQFSVPRRNSRLVRDFQIIYIYTMYRGWIFHCGTLRRKKKNLVSVRFFFYGELSHGKKSHGEKS